MKFAIFVSMVLALLSCTKKNKLVQNGSTIASVGLSYPENTTFSFSKADITIACIESCTESTSGENTINKALVNKSVDLGPTSEKFDRLNGELETFMYSTGAKIKINLTLKDDQGDQVYGSCAGSGTGCRDHVFNLTNDLIVNGNFKLTIKLTGKDGSPPSGGSDATGNTPSSDDSAAGVQIDVTVDENNPSQDPAPAAQAGGDSDQQGGSEGDQTNSGNTNHGSANIQQLTTEMNDLFEKKCAACHSGKNFKSFDNMAVIDRMVSVDSGFQMPPQSSEQLKDSELMSAIRYILRDDALKIYEAKCSSCHAPDAKGSGAMPSAEQRFCIDKMTEQALAGKIADHLMNQTMPPEGSGKSLTDEEKELLLLYIAQ